MILYKAFNGLRLTLVCTEILYCFVLQNIASAQSPKLITISDTLGYNFYPQNAFITSDYFVASRPSSYWKSFAYLYSLRSGAYIKKEKHFQVKAVLRNDQGDKLLAYNELTDSLGFYFIADSGFELDFNLCVCDSTSPYTKIEEHKGKYLLFNPCQKEILFTDGTKSGTSLEFDSIDYLGAFQSQGETYLFQTGPEYNFVKVGEGIKSTFNIDSVRSDGVQYSRILGSVFSDSLLLFHEEDSFETETFRLKLVNLKSKEVIYFDPNPIDSLDPRLYYFERGQRPALVGDKIYLFKEIQEDYWMSRITIWSLDLNTGSIEVIKDPTSPLLSRVYPRIKSLNEKLVIFGALGKEGAEPYTIQNGKIEVIKDLYPGFSPSLSRLYDEMQFADLFGDERDNFQILEHNGKLLFFANSQQKGLSVYSTDGSTQGTKLYSDIVPGYKSLGSSTFKTSTDGKVYVVAQSGREVYDLYELKEDALDNSDPVSNQWDVRFGMSSNHYNASGISLRKEARTHASNNGTFTIFQDGLSPEYEWVNYNGYEKIPAKEKPGYSYNRGLIHNVDSNGKVENIIELLSFDNKSEIGVFKEDGSILVGLQSGPEGGAIGDFQTTKNLAFSLTHLKKNGSMKWHRDFPFNEVHPLKIETTKDRFILFGWYFDFSLNLGDTLLESEINPSAFMASFSKSGDFEWARNASIDSFSYWSTLGDLTIDESSNTIYSLINESSYNWRSTCGYSDWHFNFEAIDLRTGQNRWKKTFKTGGLSRFPSLDVAKDGKVLLVGDFTSSFEYASTRIKPPNLDKLCPHSSLILFVNPSNGALEEIIKDGESKRKYLREVLVTDEGFYTASIVRNSNFEEVFNPLRRSYHHLQIDFRTHNGKLIDSKVLKLGPGEYFDANEREVNFELNIVGENDLLITTSFNGQWDTGVDTLFSFPKEYYSTKSFVVSRREGIDFEDFSPELFYDFDKSFVVFPNPLYSNTLGLVVKRESERDFSKAKLYSIKGQLVHEWDLDLSLLETQLQFNQKPKAGLYLLELSGARREVIKLVIQ